MSQSVLLQVARSSIMEVLQAERLINREELINQHPLLATPTATFVTLYLNNEVRGCMGSLNHERALIDDVIHNAKMAAFQDPRFEPISTAEYLHTTIELSLLSEPSLLSFTNIEELKSQIQVNDDGVIIEYEGKAANFLPQVWYEHKNFETFVHALCEQANINLDALETGAKIYTYRVQSASDTPILS